MRQILKAKGRPVHFRYPPTEGSRHGVLTDRVVVRGGSGAQGVAYWHVVDRIDVPGAADSPWIRVGYYRHVNGRLRWASQTTLTAALPAWKRLFKAAKKKTWFASLLRV